MSDDAGNIQRALSATVIPFNLHEEIRALRAGESFQSADHAARTLAKHTAMRVVLVAMKPGGRMEEHHTDADITVQCLEGSLRFEVEGAVHHLAPGDMLVVAERLSHSVGADSESAFLLTVGEQHRGGDGTAGS